MEKTKNQKAILSAVADRIKKDYKKKSSITKLLQTLMVMLGIAPQTEKKVRGWDKYNEEKLEEAITLAANGAPSSIWYLAPDDYIWGNNPQFLKEKMELFEQRSLLLQKNHIVFTSPASSVASVLSKIIKLRQQFDKKFKQPARYQKKTPLEVEAIPCFADFVTNCLHNTPSWNALNQEDQKRMVNICRNQSLMKELCLIKSPTYSPMQFMPHLPIKELSTLAMTPFRLMHKPSLTLRRLTPKPKSHRKHFDTHAQVSYAH